MSRRREMFSQSRLQTPLWPRDLRPLLLITQSGGAQGRVDQNTPSRPVHLPPSRRSRAELRFPLTRATLTEITQHTHANTEANTLSPPAQKYLKVFKCVCECVCVIVCYLSHLHLLGSVLCSCCHLLVRVGTTPIK